ncbi:MAG: hypothetical protein JO298_07590 [Verrucomicrobia bacterium]|nr:hypothetical protein [Verrucomicrobiota bacterium]MBV9644604.1 hypothetical protein [Verrucomicrobiota bacterium]
MKNPNQLQTLAISLSLVILALGFSALGLVSLVNTHPGSNIFSVEHAYSLIGSIFSFLVGSTFLVAAISFRGVRTESERLIGRINPNLI